MEEIEVPMEHLHEKINEEAKESSNSGTMAIALSTAFMAVFAAIAALLAGHHSNEALIKQIESSDKWAQYQSKSIKSEIANSTNKILTTLSIAPETKEKKEAVAEDLAKKMERYEVEKEEISKEARGLETEAKEHLDRHVTLSKAVTIFQIAIALSAISILTRRRWLWFGSLGLSAAGLVFLILGNI